MELKKSDAANTEKARLPLTLTGLLFVGSLVLASFSYTVSEIETDNGNNGPKMADINYQMDVQKPNDPPPPQPTQVDVPPPVTEEIVEEENTEEEPVTNIDVPPPVDIGPIEQPKVEAEIVDFPDVEAGFPGGAAEMQRWINENIQYPQTAIEMGDQGRVYLKFVVEPDGSITNVEVERGVSPDLDREAKRVVRKMPNWSPGEAGGRKVRTRCRLPIIFQLE